MTNESLDVSPRRSARQRFLVAADTGGTFTDLAVFDTASGETRFGKTLTTYGNLVAGVVAGLDDTRVGLDEALVFKHGTTHVINAFIERKGARTALITTRGFRDVLEIARGNRPETFNLRYRRDPCLIPRRHRYEVNERIAGDGSVIEPLREDEIEALVPVLRSAGIQAVAISFLNAYVNASHEEAAALRLAAAMPEVYVTYGTKLSREWMEYERTSTVAANAFVGARMSDYIGGFFAELNDRQFDGRFYLASSSGGVITPQDAIEQPIALVESGPVGGCIGAAAYARALGLTQVVAFDMGGTTAKCALIEDGRFDVVSTYWVGGYTHGFPIRTPVLDIVEVGAGGGSIGWMDDNGRLQLGPRSAGSDPGPICFGRGGKEPTITDANLVLGRIGSGNFMNGRLPLDIDAARMVISERLAKPLGFQSDDAVERVAQGMLALANVIMAGALQEITIQRGRNIRDYVVFAFGGGGPLFAAELARDLGVSQVVIPPHPGAFSSLGMLLAEARRDTAQTFIGQLTVDSTVRAQGCFLAMEQQLCDSMRQEFDVSRIVYMREAEMSYVGQSHSVKVQIPERLTPEHVRAAFELEYMSRYGHLNPKMELAFVSLRVGGVVPTAKPDLDAVMWVGKDRSPLQPRENRDVYFGQAGQWISTPIYGRAELPIGAMIAGPAVVEEYSSTTIIGVGDTLTIGHLGELRIACAQPSIKQEGTHG